MKAWFAGLARREQRMLILGAVVVSVTLCYMLVWDPLTRGYDLARADVERKSQLLAEARRSLVPAPAQTGQTGRRASAQSLTLLIANTVSTAGLSQAYKSSSPTGQDELRVALENASFDALIEWLGQLQSAHGVIVTSGSFSDRNETGRVDASIVVQRLP